MKQLIALAGTGLALILPATATATATATTVGTTKVYSAITSNTKGYAQAYRFTAASSGQVDRVSVYLARGSTASAVEVGMYGGTAARARTRLGSCVITNPRRAAWNSCAIAAHEVTAGASYWLALLQPVGTTGQMQYPEGVVKGAPTTYMDKTRHLASLPLTWRNGASWRGGYQASIQADQANPIVSTPLPPLLPDPTPIPHPLPTPTPAPISLPIATPSPAPTATPSPAPTATPSPAPTSTPSPTPTATPSPAPTPTPTPTATPSGSGCALPEYPDAGCTGVPAGTKLTPYTGPTTIRTPNTVIDGKSMGCIRVMVPGVVIRNSRISCANPAPDVVTSADGDYSGTPLLIEDSEIDCRNTGGTAVGDTNIIAERLNVHGCENGFDLDANITVADSYIHDMYNSSEAHTDGIQFGIGHYVKGEIVKGALNITIRHNTIYSVAVDGSLGTSAIISNRGGDENILIQDNLMAGGAFTLYCEQNATADNYRVLNNHFSRRFSSKVGAYGPSTDCSDETLSGNVYHESGLPVTLQ